MGSQWIITAGPARRAKRHTRTSRKRSGGGRRPWTRFLYAKVVIILVISVYVLLSAFYIFPQETILDERDVPGNSTFEFEVDSDYLEVYVGSRRAPSDPVIGYEITSDESGEVVANGTLEIGSLFAHLAERPELEVRVPEHGQHRLETVDLNDGTDDDFSFRIVQRTVPPWYDAFFIHYSLTLFLIVLVSRAFIPRGWWDNSSERYWYREEKVTHLVWGVGFILILWAPLLLMP